MDVSESNLAAGSLQISSEVIEKIACLAALEVEGVADVAADSSGVRSLLNRLSVPRPVTVEVKEDVAVVTVGLVVHYTARIPEVSEQVQRNVKQSIQNMTQITVARVNVVINGIAVEETADPQTDGIQ